MIIKYKLILFKDQSYEVLFQNIKINILDE